MTLQNLLGTSLDQIEPSRETIARLLGAAERNLADAEIPALSAENRFDAAYKAVMQLATLALHAHGYRTLTSRPGHHQTAIQTLPTTIGLPADQMIVLDAFRKQRNLSDYSGEPVSKTAVRDCISHAKALLVRVKKWLGAHRPDLL